jgi:subtilisin family serine protease
LTTNKKFQTWTESTLLDIREIPSEDGHSIHRVRLVQPPGLPYQVRVEERVKTIPETKETEVSLISETVANHLLFGLAPGATIEVLTPLLEELGAKLKPIGDLPNQYSLHLSEIYMDSALDALALINKQANGLLVYAELDNMIHISAVPNDPQYTGGQLWGLNNLGQSQGVSDVDIDGPEAWDKRTDASQVIVAVIDSGVRYTHEDLRNNMWVNTGEIAGNGVDDDNNGVVDDVHGFDGINDNGNPDDENGHGTHCAGTI